MNRRLIPAFLLVAAAGWGACESSNVAHAVPNCGGQGAAPQPVPYTCNLPGIDITAQGFTRHFSAVIHADGTTVSAVITMSAPLLVPVPVRIVHHEGISGAGGTSDQANGVIPAGATTATVTDSAPCRDGQLDVKAVFVGNGQPQGRIGGPWIRNGDSCIDLTSTVPTTSPPPVTTSPPGSTPTPGGPISPPQTPPGAGTPRPQLPATGVWNIIGLGFAAWLVIALGVALVRRTPTAEGIVTAVSIPALAAYILVPLIGVALGVRIISLAIGRGWFDRT